MLRTLSIALLVASACTGLAQSPSDDAASGGGAAGGASATGGGSATGGSSSTGGGSATGGGTANPRDAGPVDGDAGIWVDITPPGMVSAIGVGLSAAAPEVLYVDAYAAFPPQAGPSATAGIYKSTNSGQTWSGPIGTTFLNHDGTTYSGQNPWHEGVSWTIAVDPTNPDIVYAMCSFAGPQGPWKSTNGGQTWRYLFSPADNAVFGADVYAIAIDPLNPQHVLMTFHSAPNNMPASVAESLNGGQTWVQHAPPVSWGAGHYAFFLGQDDTGQPSSSAWLLATQSNGYWRTLDSGGLWTQVSSMYAMQHGAGGLYRASTGALYLGAVSHVLRSTDNGKTWADANAPSNPDGYNAVIGDGVKMYVQSANTGTNTTGPQHYSVSLETDGTHWAQQNAQTFADGPGWMAADRGRRILYSANWDHGLWRLKTGN